MYLGQGVAGGGVECIQRDHVLAAHVCDRSHQQGLYSVALADFPSDVGGDPLIGGLAHEFQSLARFFIGENIQERRLEESDSERLSQRVVEDRIPGSVDEIGYQSRVFLCKLRDTMRAKIKTAAEGRSYEYDSCGDKDFPI